MLGRSLHLLNHFPQKFLVLSCIAREVTLALPLLYRRYMISISLTWMQKHSNKQTPLSYRF
ncbi:hypothetical protein P353_16910 [Comamonas testosteroni]|uniref:Uncharacterized protein n=1 Tax=Comamonas testosteroni TaxID=285 RepID=A0A096FC41_COMTE|nr:hypothetical protein P353_16910 [Comamonas testosteroni]